MTDLLDDKGRHVVLISLSLSMGEYYRFCEVFLCSGHDSAHSRAIAEVAFSRRVFVLRDNSHGC